MVFCLISLSQRCNIASIGRTLKYFKRIVKQGNILCVASFIHSQKQRSVYCGQSDEFSQISFLNQYRHKVAHFLQYGSEYGCSNHHRVDLKIYNSRILSGSRHVHSDAKDKGIGKEMREKTILTIPNILSFGRIVACPFLGSLVLSENHLAALLLFITAGITDWLDGFIARKYPSQMSYLGSVLDPIADKLLIGVLTVTLTMVHLIPVPLAVIILGRDVGLIISSFVVRFISLPRPKTFSRFFDLQLPTVQVTPSLIGKLNTALQLGLISLSLIAPVLHFTDHIGLGALQYVVGLTTLVSGVDYMITGRGVNILTKPKNNSKS